MERPAQANRRSPKRTPRRAAGPIRPREGSARRLERARLILDILGRLYPGATTELQHSSAYELLVATILSAQSTDANVNKVMPGLLAKYPDVRALARADVADLQERIHSTGFFRQKAKSLLGASKRMVDAYGGEVPSTMEDLVTLPGVARKTANVVLGTWFHRNEGIVVDTHVGRVATRLALTWTSKGKKDAVRIEGDLMTLIPVRAWAFFGHAMTLHGRRVCHAKKPNCAGCALAPHCPSALRCEPRRSAPRAR